MEQRFFPYTLVVTSKSLSWASYPVTCVQCEKFSLVWYNFLVCIFSTWKRMEGFHERAMLCLFKTVCFTDRDGHLFCYNSNLLQGVTIIGPATVGGIKPGCFKIGNTGGMLDNILESKLYRPGRYVQPQLMTSLGTLHVLRYTVKWLSKRSK